MKTTTLKQSPKTEPTLVKRPAGERGQTELGWLHSRHTFSFGHYFDPNHMGFRSLRVIVIDGELEHNDSMGNGRVIKAGDLQYISAGNGLFHSEFNPSPKKPVHFLQIWLTPTMSGGEPRYAEKSLGQAARLNDLTLLFAGEPRGDAVGIRADADIFFGRLEAKKQLVHRSSPGRAQWLHVIDGEVSVLGETLKTGDGAAIENAESLEIQSREGAQFLLFDLK